MKHLFGFPDGAIGVLVDGVAFLPEEFAAAEEGAGGFFPANDGNPLVVELRKVTVRVNNAFVVLAKQGFGGGANTEALFKFFLAAYGNPGAFGGKAFNVVFFFLKKAFGDKHGHTNVFVPGGFKHLV